MPGRMLAFNLYPKAIPVKSVTDECGREQPSSARQGAKRPHSQRFCVSQLLPLKIDLRKDALSIVEIGLRLGYEKVRIPLRIHRSG